MFDFLIGWALKQRSVIILLFVCLVSGAVLMTSKLNLDAFPDVTNVQVSINTPAPGLGAQEVEQLITYPIEAVMYALPNVTQVRSISKTGLSGVTVVFKENTDIYFARQLVFERLQTAKELIPQNVGTPEMGPNTSGLGQVYQYLLLADADSGYDTMALRSLNDWLIKLLIMPIDGVTEVLSFGGSVKQYQVGLNPDKLLAYSLSQQDVIKALEASNDNVGGWYLNRAQEQLVVRGVGWFSAGTEGIKQLKQVAIKTVAGTVVTVGDVATVQLGSEIRQGAVTFSRKAHNGEIKTHGEVVTGVVLKRMGANTKQTIDGIKDRIALIEQALPDGITFEPFYDQADLITQAVNTVVTALALAFILIIVVLALFLMNLRATVLVLISIPIAIVIALGVMAGFGMSANLMSLGGIAVAIGMLVDGSVVMVENIVKKLQQHCSAPSSNLATLVQSAAQEVARPIFFATLMIIVVFAPLFSFEGVEAKLFEPMAISIILALISALFVALILVPALAVILFRQGVSTGRNHMLEALSGRYAQALSTLMQFKKTVIFSTLSMIFLSAGIFTQLGNEFVPELEEGTINLRVTLAPSASLDTALSVAPKLEQTLLTFPEVTYALSRIGRAEIGGDPEPVNNIEIYIGLKPITQWQSANNRQELQHLMEEELSQFPGLLLNFSQPIATRVDELLSGVKAQLAIKLFGPDLDVLALKGEEIEELVKTISGTQDVALEQITGEAQLIVTPRRQALARYGLKVADVMALVSEGIGGIEAGQIINGNERYDIYVRLQQSYRDNMAAIKNLLLRSQSGAWVRLEDVATVAIESGPPQIRRDDVQRRVVIQANIQGQDMGSVVAQIQQQIAQQVSLPSGYSVQIGGQFESQQRAQQRLSLVIPLSLCAITLLLYFTFNSVRQAVLILINIPLAVVGGVWALYLSDQYISVPASVGFITLFGVAVLNGVVMVERINQNLASGMDLTMAIHTGAVSRLRPVLMTALTSALGLIPMLLSSGVGSEIQRPLATVIVGGLVSSTLLTLIVIPTLYSRFTKLRVC